MREIKYRGITADGEIVFGHIAQFAVSKKTHIKPETVSQYTGAKDSKGIEVFEGDLIKCSDGFVYEIVFSSEGFYAKSKNAGGYFFIDDLSKIEVIGNIHKNPELLK